MTKGLHKFCVLSGVVCGFMAGYAYLTGHLFPWVFLPTDSAESVAAYYADHHTRLQIAYTVGAMGACFWLPFSCAMAWEVKKMCGAWKDLMSNVQVGFGVMFALIGFFPYCVFLAATYRPERDPEIIRTLNDLGFNMFEAPQGVAILYLTLLGIVALNDKRPIRTFPKWYSYLCFVTAGFDLLGSFVAFDKTGPWAWNGLFAAWCIAIIWGVQLQATIFYLLKAVDREWDEQTAADIYENIWDEKLLDQPADKASVVAEDEASTAAVPATVT